VLASAAKRLVVAWSATVEWCIAALEPQFGELREEALGAIQPRC
jgi:hypothetical protein